MKSFKYELGASVKLTHSDEHGTVIGRYEHSTQPDSYLIRYKAGDGRQVESWWEESAIQLAE